MTDTYDDKMTGNGESIACFRPLGYRISYVEYEKGWSYERLHCKDIVRFICWIWCYNGLIEYNMHCNIKREFMMTENSILIIDDDKDLCELLRESIWKEKIYADIIFNGFDGIKSINNKEYQLVVLDVMMPGISGFEALEKIRAQSNVPILMLTAKDDSASKVKGLRAGADDYLTKPFKMEEFIARVLSLIRRYTQLNNIVSESILEYEKLKIDLASGIVEVSGEEIELSAKEYEVLIYFAQNQGKILTKKQIYESIWNEEYIYDDNNVMAVISRLRKKLEKSTDQPVYIQTVRGLGYRFNKEI